MIFTVIYFEYENVVNIPSTNSVPESYETVNYKFVWNGIKQTLYTDALSTETVQSKFASIISSVANVSDRNSTDINVHVNDSVKIVSEGYLTAHLLKMTGIMIIVKIKREFLIMHLMILERIVQMKIDINL